MPVRLIVEVAVERPTGSRTLDVTSLRGDLSTARSGGGRLLTPTEIISWWLPGLILKPGCPPDEGS